MQRDYGHMLDMVVYARRALAHAESLTRDALDESLIAQDAIVRCIEVVGEASHRVSEAATEKHPQIEWRRIAGMRNRLIHDYDEVDLDLVWTALEVDLPRLIAALEPIIPPEDALHTKR